MKKGFLAGASSPTALALIGANVVPLIGAAFFGWSVFSLMFLFWLENVIIGVLNIVRFLAAAPARDAEAEHPGIPRPFLLAGRIFMACFFAVHYGGFCTGHGVFVFGLFGKEAGVRVPHGLGAGIGVAAQLLLEQKLVIAASCIFISHLFSLCYNYFYKGERYGAQLGAIMARPYGRIVVLHITIIVGAIPVMVLGSPVWALVPLVVLKTMVDLKAHLMERNKMGRYRLTPPS